MPESQPTASTSQHPTVEIAPEDRLAVRALNGDKVALLEAARRRDAGAPSRLGAALALRARRAGLEPSLVEQTSWRRELRRNMVQRLQFEPALESVTDALGKAGIPWLVIKGNDLATRVYEVPEERPSLDLDVLVAPADLGAARRALEAKGWLDFWPSDAHSERFLAEESYCWTARSNENIVLELHFRFWGMVPEGLVAEMLSRATADPDRQEWLRLSSSDAFVVAACHLFQCVPPRDTLVWWDLEKIAASAGEGLTEAVVDVARRWDLQLPLALASHYAGALWGCRQMIAIGDLLWPELRMSERWVARRALGSGVGRLPLSRLVLARLLAGRRSRSGWLGLRRRLWAHPGVVARSTPPRWPWIARRLFHLLVAMGPNRARSVRGYLDRRYPETVEPSEASQAPSERASL